MFSRRYLLARRGRPGLFLGLAIGVLSIGAPAQDPLVTLPQNYRIVFENSAVTVIHARYGPHEKVPVHDHPSVSTVFVYLSDSGKVRIDHSEGTSAESVVRPPTAKGSYRVAPGLAERHSIENLGDTSSDFLRVELKQVSLELKVPFRGKAPVSLLPEDSVEFDAPGVQIERIVCVAGRTCEVKASAAPSLLVALRHLALIAGAEPREAMEDGAVRWLPASQAAIIGSDQGAGPAHLLRILLPAARR